MHKHLRHRAWWFAFTLAGVALLGCALPILALPSPYGSQTERTWYSILGLSSFAAFVFALCLLALLGTGDLRRMRVVADPGAQWWALATRPFGMVRRCSDDLEANSREAALGHRIVRVHLATGDGSLAAEIEAADLLRRLLQLASLQRRRRSEPVMLERSWSTLRSDALDFEAARGASVRRAAAQ